MENIDTIPQYLKRDVQYMQLALEQAKLAYQRGEVPVGAVIVKDGEVLAATHNDRENGHCATAHAEVLAIQQACSLLKSWRLSGCELFVTLEPCPMCAGAILNARIDRVVYGAKDSVAGFCGSVADLFAMDIGFQPIVKSGILAEASSELLTAFFKGLR